MYDIGGDIDLSTLHKIFAKSPAQVELKYTTLTPRYVKLDPPPVQIEFKKKKIKGSEYDQFIRVYSLGAVTVCFKKKFACQFNQLNTLSDSNELRREADVAAARLIKELGPCIKREYEHPVEPEDYTAYVVKRTEKRMTGADFLKTHKREIAALLREEQDADVLSDEEVERACKHAISYYKDDLAVAGYVNAFLLSRNDEADKVLSLELANIQLLELRTYSGLLDKLLVTTYKESREGIVRSFFGSLFSNRLTHSARKLAGLRMDITDLVGNVLNTTRFVGDWLTARIYSSASERLHLPARQTEVIRKLEVLEQFYTVALEQSMTRRNVYLEAIIVLLIAFEIGMALLKTA